MRLLRVVAPLVLLLTASPAAAFIGQSNSEECKYDWCYLDGECLSTCVAVYNNIFLEDASQLTTTTHTAASNTETATNSNSNSVSDRITSLLERLQRVEVATRQHQRQHAAAASSSSSSSSTSHDQPITGIVDTGEESPDGSGIPFRRAQFGPRPPTDDNDEEELIEQHVTIPQLLERVARIEKLTHHHATRQHQQQQQHATALQPDNEYYEETPTGATGTDEEALQSNSYENDDEEESSSSAGLSGVIGTSEEVPGEDEDGPGQQFFRGQFAPHESTTEGSSPPFTGPHPEINNQGSSSFASFLERITDNSNLNHAINREQLQHLFTEHHHADINTNTNTQTATNDQGYPIHFGGVAHEDGSWFTFAAGAADEQQQPEDDTEGDDMEDYYNLLERRARAATRHGAVSRDDPAEALTGVIGTDEEVPGEEGPGNQFFRGQFAPHSTNEVEEDQQVERQEEEDVVPEQEFTALMEQSQRLQHAINMAELHQQHQQHQTSLLEADAAAQAQSRISTRHHARSSLRRLRAAIDAART